MAIARAEMVEKKTGQTELIFAGVNLSKVGELQDTQFLVEEYLRAWERKSKPETHTFSPDADPRAVVKAVELINQQNKNKREITDSARTQVGAYIFDGQMLVDQGKFGRVEWREAVAGTYMVLIGAAQGLSEQDKLQIMKPCGSPRKGEAKPVPVTKEMFAYSVIASEYRQLVRNFTTKRRFGWIFRSQDRGVCTIYEVVEVENKVWEQLSSPQKTVYYDPEFKTPLD